MISRKSDILSYQAEEIGLSLWSIDISKASLINVLVMTLCHIKIACLDCRVDADVNQLLDVIVIPDDIGVTVG